MAATDEDWLKSIAADLKYLMDERELLKEVQIALAKSRPVA